MSLQQKPVVLVVRDGWGRNPHPEHNDFNAIRLAQTPRGDALLEQYPHTLIQTCCRDVGLPDGTMGNSEVGHQNLGAGRIVNQESVRISVAIEDESFYDNHAIADAIQQAKNNNRNVHLLGIASDAGVHGMMDHLYACVEACKRHDLPADRVLLHLFMDGRDTGPFTGKQYLEQIEARLDDIGVGRIASIVGRYYAMDRDNRWERIHKTYRLLTEGNPDGESSHYRSAADAIRDYYDHPTGDSQQGDEFVTPRTVGTDPEATRIGPGDSVIFYNYRGDRPRELTRAFMQPDFHGNVPPSPDSGEQGFDRGPSLDLHYVCMTAYDQTFNDYPGLHVAFPKPPKMDRIGGEVIAQHGLTQFRCAESEKFPHVTFFFNDYREENFEGEQREKVASPQVATYDLQPEMSARGVADRVLERIKADDCEDFILVNFANADMVGHTGKLDAAIKAVETVDALVGEIVDATLDRGGKLIVTADHGNSEQMFDPNTQAPHTAHTLYPVECIIVDPDLDASTPLRDEGRLADVFPTLLHMLQLDPPDAMTGTSLLFAPPSA